MEINVFQQLINITQNKWYHISDFGVIAGYQFKLAGYEWKTNLELTQILIEMTKCGFIEVDENDKLLVKISDNWYDYKSV
jgi:hypothetical protein